MSQRWQSYAWQTVPGGVSSAVTPEILPTSQYAWGYNIAIRGGKPHTRPPFVERPCGDLPMGLLQGASYFGVQNGMIVCSIAGNIYRIRIGENIYSWEPITLGFRNSGVLNQCWMQQTVETLIIQDGQSNAILYNGSTARRAVADEVPRGRQMAYGNGRLWVAVGLNQLAAGDIRTNTLGSELAFTEVDYLSGGGTLYFARPMTGLKFIPITGAADFGTLIVFGNDYAESIRADVTSRDQWGMPGFVTNVFRDIGCAGQVSICQVNQDLYWRDGHGSIRSLANSISSNYSPGSTPISREVNRLVGYDSDQLLPWVSGIYFDNRLLMTSSPYLNISGGVSFKDVVSLDFSPISTMQVKAPPAYDGQWTGIPGISQLITGQFDGKNRAFALSSDQEGVNRLWEIMTDGRADLAISCGSGIVTESPITSFIEYPSANFGLEKARKRLQRCDVWLSGIDGTLDLTIYWRPDNTQKWTKWDEVPTCAKTTDAATDTPHVWKNMLPQYRPQIKSFTIPDTIDAVTKYALDHGFYFQIRVEWTGQARIEKVMLHALYDDDPDYAEREALTAECIENDVSDNNINYVIPTSTGYMAIEPFEDISFSGPEGGPFTTDMAIYTITNRSIDPVDWTLSVSEEWLIPDSVSGTLAPGASHNIGLALEANALLSTGSPYSATISFVNLTNGCGSRDFTATLVLTSDSPGEPINLVIEGRTNGGIASLVGCPEYIPTIPAKTYLRAAYSGTVTAQFWGLDSGNCEGPPDGAPDIIAVYGSWLQYDAETGESTIGGENTYNGVPTPGGAVCGHLVDYCDQVWTYTSTVASAHGTETCCESGYNFTKQTPGGTLQLTLTEEDTDSNAITRLLASTSYTSYSTIIAQGGIKSEYNQRTTLTEFLYELAQYRFTATGLAASQLYNGTAIITRRVQGSIDPWVFVSTVSVSAMTDGSGNFSYGPHDLPIAVGYEYTVWNATLTP